MLYPGLKRIKEKYIKNNAFGGIENKERVTEGCFSDMENLSSDFFPLLSVRNPRAVWTGDAIDDAGEGNKADGLLGFFGRGITAAASAGDRFCFCTDTDAYVNGQQVLYAKLRKDVKRRSIVPFGNGIFIIPDAEHITYNSGYYVSHCSNIYHNADEAAFEFCDSEGNTVEVENYSIPDFPSEGQQYVGEAEGSMYLYEYSQENGWQKKMQLFGKIIAKEIGIPFAVGDRLFVPPEFFANGECVVKRLLAEDTIVVSCILYGTSGHFRNFTASKKIPEMDFATEHNNRIWGCRYGYSDNGEFVNEIYASALGDPGKWDCFEGTSMDSYRVSLGCSGEFTGVGKLGNDIFFFKEEYIIRISGETPADFTVMTSAARGVQEGCERSIINLNERLYYKSRYGVMAYDGTFPVSVSEALGKTRYSDAVAGGIDNKYYIAMTDEYGRRSIFVFNTLTGQWFREDDKFPTQYMLRLRNCLYYITRRMDADRDGLSFYSICLYDSGAVSQSGNIMSEDENAGYSFSVQDKVDWYALTGKLGENTIPYRQVLRRLLITLSLSKGAKINVYIITDEGDEKKRICVIDTPVNKVFTVPVNTPPCHSYRLYFEGHGECRIHSIVRLSELAGQVRNIG